MIDLFWTFAIVAANWLGAFGGAALSLWWTHRGGHDIYCDHWGPCQHEIAEDHHTTTEES